MSKTMHNYLQYQKLKDAEYREDLNGLLQVKDPGTSMLTYESAKPKDMT